MFRVEESDLQYRFLALLAAHSALSSLVLRSQEDDISPFWMLSSKIFQ